jgi:hypothetical protein
MIGGVAARDQGRKSSLRFVWFGLALALIVPALGGLSAVSANAVASPGLLKLDAPTQLIGPNTILVGRTFVVFSPKRLAKSSTGLAGLPSVSDADCSVKDYSFSISNSASTAQTVTYNGLDVVTVQPNDAYALCVNEPGKYTLGLSSNPAAKLRIVVA